MANRAPEKRSFLGKRSNNGAVASPTHASGEQERSLLRRHGGVAQLGEHLPCKQGVKSSNLSIST